MLKKYYLLWLLMPWLVLSFSSHELPRVFLAGDSTMANKKPEDAPETGWGMVVPNFFDTKAVAFENHAVNGRSTRSFRSLGHWDAMMARVRPGDYVFIQFGHNDAKVSDTLRSAPAHTDYKQNLIRFVAEVRSKGAQPILLTPVVRRNFDESGHFTDAHGDYPSVVREVATSQQVPLIDLWEKSRAMLEKLGPEASKALFMHLRPGVYAKFPDGKVDNTHFSPHGAGRVAALVAEGVAALDIPLRQHLKTTAFEHKYAYELPQIDEPVFRPDTFDIRHFGAQAGGIALNTSAIQQAIDTCHHRGGGVVRVPAGLWLTGPLQLRSYVNLRVEQGGLLQFTDDFDQYPLVRTNWEGLDAIRNHSPLYGVDLESVALTGGGIIDGAGDAWRPVKASKLTESEWTQLIGSGGVLNEAKDIWYPTETALRGASRPRPGVIAEGYDEAKAMEVKVFLRPNMVSLVRCQRVLIEGLTFQNSPAWTLHPLLCTHFTLRGVMVKNPSYAQNGDGVDVESTRFFKIENCIFDTGDDGICLKSGRNEEGRRRGVPTSDGLVHHCVVHKAHGGFVIGSEMSGGVRNIFVSGCTFLGSDIGLRFKTTRGRGGAVEDIYIAQINMVDIPHEAILFDMYYNGREAAEALKNPEMEQWPVDEGTPVFRRIFIQDIACRGGRNAIYAQGLPEMNVQQIDIRNAVFDTDDGITLIEADGINLHNITLNVRQEKAAIQVVNSRNLVLNQVRFSGEASGALKVSGKQNGPITLIQTDVKSLGVSLGQEVDPNLIKNQ